MPNRPEGYKDMVKFQITRNAQRKRYYHKTAFKYERKPWSLADDELVLQHKMTDTELSARLERSVGAIQGRRYLLKKAMNES